MNLILIFLTVLFAILFNPARKSVFVFWGYCFWVFILLGWLVIFPDRLSWEVIIKYLLLSSWIFTFLYRLRWSDFKFSDFFLARTYLSVGSLKGGRTQKLILYSSFLLFLMMCLFASFIRLFRGNI